LEALQFVEGAAPGAPAGIDDPLEALEGGGIGGEGVAGGAGQVKVTSIFLTTKVL
jgi:hypothetical protein